MFLLSSNEIAAVGGAAVYDVDYDVDYNGDYIWSSGFWLRLERLEKFWWGRPLSNI